MLFNAKVDNKKFFTLAEKYIVPPFSVFDTKQKYWAERVSFWKKLGIKSELGRGGNGTNFGKTFGVFEKAKFSGATSETSIFDPVLCEIMYRWFSPERECKILDPFAGGSVRGVVAVATGRQYTGIDLSERQIEANKQNFAEIKTKFNFDTPTWICGDSNKIDELVSGEFDFIFSCPPYFNLEVYSDKAEDISAAKTYEDFLSAYKSIIKKSCDKLKENRFAAFVVSEVRGKDGGFVGFVPDTVKAFTEAGLKFYNEAVLLNNLGTAPIRVGKQFNNSRKIVRVHQNVLIFYKGDLGKINDNFGSYFKEVL